MQHERRKARRIPLDSLYFVEVIFENGNFITGLVIDISSGGLMIGLPPAAPENIEPKISEKGRIEDASPELAEVLKGDLSLTVMWVKEGLCGLAFDTAQPLIDSQFHAENLE